MPELIVKHIQKAILKDCLQYKKKLETIIDINLGMYLHVTKNIQVIQRQHGEVLKINPAHIQ